MKIVDAQVQFSSQHALREEHKVEQTVFATTSTAAAETASRTSPNIISIDAIRSSVRESLELNQSEIDLLSDADTRSTISSLSNTPAFSNVVASLFNEKVSEADTSMKGMDVETYRLKSIIESFTGKELELSVSRQYEKEQAKARLEQRQQQSSDNVQLLIERTESITEYERSDFSAQGSITTASGQLIDFNIEQTLERYFQQESSVNLQLSQSELIDPLVVNLDSSAISLTEKKYQFDLNSNGEDESISFVSKGNAFLALDRNGNGQVDNGNELFGTHTGDGFAELARYDEDGNRFIDENDSIYSQLLLWQKDTNGNDTLTSIAQQGIGALYLDSQATTFAIKNEENRLQGMLKSSGVFIHESGKVGTLHQLDLAV